MQSRVYTDSSKPDHKNHKFQLLGKSESADTNSPMPTPLSDLAT